MLWPAERSHAAAGTAAVCACCCSIVTPLVCSLGDTTAAAAWCAAAVTGSTAPLLSRCAPAARLAVSVTLPSAGVWLRTGSCHPLGCHWCPGPPAPCTADRNVSACCLLCVRVLHQPAGSNTQHTHTHHGKQQQQCWRALITPAAVVCASHHVARVLLRAAAHPHARRARARRSTATARPKPCSELICHEGQQP
jgi:hypothetical protein